MELVELVYRATRTFPREEQFGLTSQIRRSAVSVPANIAEGYGRSSKPHFANFCRIAQGSLYELRTELEVAARTGIAAKEEMQPLMDLAERLSRMLDGFIRSLNQDSDSANR